MHLVEFAGDFYRDDRMYVLHLAKCTEKEEVDHVATTIYHEDPPQGAKWCLVTYLNNERYRATRVDKFETQSEAEAYMRHIEPTVPLISLGGQPPTHPMSYEDFCVWKRDRGMKDYDYKEVFSQEGENPMELIFRRK